jgi:hypothetical protein
MWLMNRVVNPVVRGLLRSPLHRLLSRRLVLLRVTGRRSGRTFELPVAYVRGDTGLVVTVGAPERKRWWRNIEGPTPITAVLRGRTRSGVAEVTTSEGTTQVRIELSDERPAPASSKRISVARP